MKWVRKLDWLDWIVIVMFAVGMYAAWVTLQMRHP